MRGITALERYIFINVVIDLPFTLISTFSDLLNVEGKVQINIFLCFRMRTIVHRLDGKTVRVFDIVNSLIIHEVPEMTGGCNGESLFKDIVQVINEVTGDD